jgi:hypothetical protein
MSVFAHVDGLGAVLEQVQADSILAHRKEFHSRRKIVDTLAETLEEVRMSVSVRPAGVAMVTVECKGKGFLESSVQCFRLKRTKLGSWQVSASSLDRK